MPPQEENSRSGNGAPGKTHNHTYINSRVGVPLHVHPRDRLLLAFEQTAELARDFKRNARIDKDEPSGLLFRELAEYESVCAQKLKNALLDFEPGM